MCFGSSKQTYTPQPPRPVVAHNPNPNYYKYQQQQGRYYHSASNAYNKPRPHDTWQTSAGHRKNNLKVKKRGNNTYGGDVGYAIGQAGGDGGGGGGGDGGGGGGGGAGGGGGGC